MDDRRKFLGGSDAAAVMGLSPWMTPVELWRQKTGRSEPPRLDKLREKILKRGHLLEPVIVEMAVDKLRDAGHTVELIARNERYADPEHPFLSCEIDFELRLDGEEINGDAKSVGGFAREKWGEEETDEVPIEYAAQFMAGLGITGRHRCLVAALMSLDDVALYWVHRDDVTIAAMRERCVRFWNDHVLADVPPDPIDYSDVKLLYPRDNGTAIEATDDIAGAVAKLRDATRQRLELERTEEYLQFQIAAFMQPHARLTRGGRDIATWKGQSRSDIDRDALKADHPGIYADYMRTSTVRVLRPKKGF